MICQTMVCQTTTHRLALGSSYSKPSAATAEDSLPHLASRQHLAKLQLRQYSRGARPMQRGHRTSNRLLVHSLTAYGRVERVRALELYSKRSFGESNAHSGPLAATRTEAHVVQRTREGGSDRRGERHIPGSGIPPKIGSKRIWQRKSRNTCWLRPF